MTIRDSTFTAIESLIEDTGAGTGIDVLIGRTSFDDVDRGDGLEINVKTDSTVTLTDVGASRNAGNGVAVDVDGNSTFTATRLTLDDNGSSGLKSVVTGGASATIAEAHVTSSGNRGVDLLARHSGSTLTFSDSSSIDNDDDGIEVSWASQAGDAPVQAGGEVVIVDSTVDRNRYGIYNTSRNLDFTGLNLTIVGSTIARSGSIGLLGSVGNGSIVKLINSTVSGNAAVYNTLGIDLFGYGSGTVSIAHSTITANIAGAGVSGIAALFSGALNVSIDHSIVAGNVGGVDFEHRGNGTLTIDHSLIGVAAGLTAAAAIAGEPEFDQRGTGYPRIVLGRIDMGAVERSPELVPTGAETAPLGLAALALLGLGVAVLGMRRVATAR